MSFFQLQALEFIHKNNFTQGDIKPENIMYSGGDLSQVYFLDFGLSSQYFIDGKHQEMTFKKTNENNGTLRYCPIDSHEGFKISRRGDLEMLIYSMMECITKKLPWND